jgi:hypothetical protein
MCMQLCPLNHVCAVRSCDPSQVYHECVKSQMLPLYSAHIWVENVLNRVSEGGVFRLAVVRSAGFTGSGWSQH